MFPQKDIIEPDGCNLISGADVKQDSAGFKPFGQMERLSVKQEGLFRTFPMDAGEQRLGGKGNTDSFRILPRGIAVRAYRKLPFTVEIEKRISLHLRTGMALPGVTGELFSLRCI